MKRNIVIIPSLNPDNSLLKLVDELKKEGLKDIIVVDDGSEKKDVFDKLKGITLLTHEINRGKGAAIKTAVSNADKYFKNINGIITCDCDGQHKVKDIKKISDALDNNIVLGVRNFGGKNVPFRSKFGNKFSSIYFKIVTGRTLNDTQTGLRGIPYKYKKFILEVEGDRFDYEMNFLLDAAKKKIAFDTIPIQTVYINKNKGSNFSAIKDSYLIYKDFFKYLFSAGLSFVLDFGLFNLFGIWFKVFTSTIIARILSSIFNFTLNKNYVFENKSKNTFYKYVGLCLFTMLMSATFVSLFTKIGFNKNICKIIVDTVLFVFNYFVQKIYIFKK